MAGTAPVERELDRVLTRLLALGPVRVVRPGPDGVRPAERLQSLLQHLADLAAGAEDALPRAVPALAAHALGDQLVVLVRDALASAPAAAPDVAARLVALRRSL